MRHEACRRKGWVLGNQHHACCSQSLSLSSHPISSCLVSPWPPPSLDDVRAFNPHRTQCVRQRPPLQVRPCIDDDDPESPPRFLGLQQQLVSGVEGVVEEQ